MMPCDWCQLGPLQWCRYVNKQVAVKAGKDVQHRGWLLTVDPVSASVVLVNFTKEEGEKEGAAEVQVVMGHVVEEVEVLQEADQETARRLQTCFLPPSAVAASQQDPEELARRRDSIRQWLEKNRVPVQEEGAELRVAGVLTIAAPYRPSDCSSSNQIILDRIQKLVCALKPD